MRRETGRTYCSRPRGRCRATRTSLTRRRWSRRWGAWSARRHRRAWGWRWAEADGLCYNELRFYLPDGTYLGCHTKTLLCGTITEPTVGEINHFATKPLRVFDFNGITVGGLICNDMWANPGCTPTVDTHLSHRLAQMGAKVIFHAVNGGRDDSELSQVTTKRFHECHVLLKAAADDVFIVTVDNSFPHTMPTSSIGGVAGPDARWAYRMEDKGQQFGVYTLEWEET